MNLLFLMLVRGSSDETSLQLVSYETGPRTKQARTSETKDRRRPLLKKEDGSREEVLMVRRNNACSCLWREGRVVGFLGRSSVSTTNSTRSYLTVAIPLTVSWVPKQFRESYF
jgi:hypothetical protein